MIKTLAVALVSEICKSKFLNLCWKHLNRLMEHFFFFFNHNKDKTVSIL